MNKENIIWVLLAIVISIGGYFAIASIGQEAEPIKDSVIAKNFTTAATKTSGFDKLDVVVKDVNKSVATLYYWGREGYIDVSVPGVATEKPIKIDEDILTTKSLVQKYSDKSIKMAIPDDDPNSFEFDIIIESYPKEKGGNMFTFKIDNYENLSFYYQPPLYEEYGLSAPNGTCNATDCNGAHRPENIVGSYAVYGNKQGNEYTTGKIFHIYRPKIIAEDGSWTYGDMNYKNGNLTVTADDIWLSKAKYPVLIDPIFGTNKIGGTEAGSPGADHWVASGFASPSNLNSLDNCSFYTKESISGSTKVVIVLNSTLNIVTNGVSNSVSPTSTAMWYVYTFSTKPTVSASTVYDLGTTCSGFGCGTYFCDSAIGEEWYDGSNSYATPTNPTDATRTHVVHKDRRISIYCNYTATVTNTPPTLTSQAPANNTALAYSKPVVINVTYTDAEATAGTVSFVNQTSGAVFCTNASVASGTVVRCGINMDKGTYTKWYANASDGTDITTSGVYNFSVNNYNPSITLKSPVNNTEYSYSIPYILNVTYSHGDLIRGNIIFYNSSNGAALCTNNSVVSGTDVKCGVNVYQGQELKWYVNATDTYNNLKFGIWNFSVTPAPPDTCTYSGTGNWNIDCADNCQISTSYNLGGNNIFATGTGTVLFNAAKPRNFARFKIEGTSAVNRCLVRILG